MSNLCVKCKHFRNIQFRPRAACSHPDFVGSMEKVYGSVSWPNAENMRTTGACGDEGLLFEPIKKKTLTQWIFS